MSWRGPSGVYRRKPDLTTDRDRELNELNESAEGIKKDNTNTTSRIPFASISSSGSTSSSNTSSTTKVTTSVKHESTTSTSNQWSIAAGSDIVARNIGPVPSSSTSTTAKPSTKRQISLDEFQRLVAKVNDEIQLLRNQSINLSRTYDDLVQRYNERISQLSIQMDDGTERTPGAPQIVTTTGVPSVSLANNQFPPLMTDNDRQQPNYLTNICGNNYYNYIHYYMYPLTEEQMNLVAAQQGRKGGGIVHQLAAGRQAESDNELDQRYDSAASSDSWQPASFYPRNVASVNGPDVPAPPPFSSAATLIPTQSTPKRLEEFLARHKITLDPVLLATSPPIPITTTPIPLEKVLTVEHPPHLALAIPTTAKPVPGNSRNGWDGFDFQFVRKAMESKRRAEADGETERPKARFFRDTCASCDASGAALELPGLPPPDVTPESNSSDSGIMLAIVLWHARPISSSSTAAPPVSGTKQLIIIHPAIDTLAAFWNGFQGTESPSGSINAQRTTTKRPPSVPAPETDVPPEYYDALQELLSKAKEANLQL
ncbi:hypothetical protein AND_007830 [Anopheles darlingi]|uniref:Uncharacterized protein n=1 Tax=Anopheles darlingi TaxID=43151 RepID=W5JCD1_ANODA|nr:hypothetical protein AND_007830 [Anopheles darlingi]